MENASKALIIAAEIMFGVILLTMFLLMYFAWSNFSGTVDNNLRDVEINKFNSQFQVYNGRNDLTAHDVITIMNLAEEYNKKVENDPAYTITVTGVSVGDKLEFIQDNINKKFKINSIYYNNKTKLVKTITINQK